MATINQEASERTAAATAEQGAEGVSTALRMPEPGARPELPALPELSLRSEPSALAEPATAAFAATAEAAAPHDVASLVAEIARRAAVENELRASLHELRDAEQLARRAAEDLAGFLDNAPVPIHSVDASATIVWANRAELALLGYAADEYIGRPMAAFHADPPVLADMLARLARGETLLDYEARLRAKDGSIRHVLVSSNMHERDGALVCSRCFSRDITDRKRAEDERDAVIADLSRTVRLNETFAGILGHDLRGPLSTIVMASQLMLSYIDEPRAVRTLQRVLSSASRMQQMISQLLDFARARIDGGVELERKAIDISEIARDVIEEIRFARPEWTIDVELHGDVRGDYDGNRLSQVFSNLIGNAVQHGSPEAPLRIRIDGREPAGIDVEIRNRGAIPPEIIPVVFSPFRGTHQRGAHRQGLGLGLFITDHIVRAHGGQIAVEAADDTTAFRFHLPRRSSTAPSVATFDPEDASSSADMSDPARRIAGLGNTSLDASERRAVHDAVRVNEERFRLLVDAVKDYAIFMLDADGYVATWNSGAERITGYRVDEIIGRHIAVFYPRDVAASKTAHELEVASRDGRFEDEDWRLRKDGSKFWANVVLTAMREPDGMLIGYAKITRDLTERKKLEEERVALAHAQEAVRLRDEFLSLASHELKTPLTVLQLQLDSLRDRLDSSDRATLAKLERSSRAGQRLAELVEALLDVSRIATGRFELQLEHADAAEIVATAVDRMHETAAAAGCTLSVATEHVVGWWDRSRIDQAISNLVSNATRYAAGTSIEVAVTREDGAVAIAVRDRGPGLPEGQILRMFERFERGVPMRHFGGLGLGLYLVHQIAEAHRGSVSANNLEDGGACFTLRLPLDSPDHPTVA
jgi:PAS domain S-box-containing protein